MARAARDERRKDKLDRQRIKADKRDERHRRADLLAAAKVAKAAAAVAAKEAEEARRAAEAESETDSDADPEELARRDAVRGAGEEGRPHLIPLRVAGVVCVFAMRAMMLLRFVTRFSCRTGRSARTRP
jgi:hypothetical protein